MMIMMEARREIACPICQKAKSNFDLINRRINHARSLAEKVAHARELLEKVEAVLKEHQKVDVSLAEVCRIVLNVRKQTAELILKFER
jgi:hypothetical protein